MNSIFFENEVYFQDIVFKKQEEVLPPSKSRFGKTYDFYHDCILRYIKTNSIALSQITENTYPENWTYEKIHRCVNYQVDKWTCHDLQPGEFLAIVGAPDIHFILALMTAFRFGLKIVYLPTNSPFLGQGQIFKFLKEIKPKFIASENSCFLLEGIKLLTINEKGFDDENYEPHSFSYSAKSELQIALSLISQEALALISLDAQTVYLHALREALFTLNLVQHPYWAAPLACPIRTEPCSTLISLLSGATKLYVSDEGIKSNPELLQDERIHLIGFSKELKQLWSQTNGLPTRYLKHCYKNPLEIESQAWKTFISLNKLEKIPQFNLIMDNASGGGILFSNPTVDLYNVFLQPSLGSSWYLSHINKSGQESLTGFGIFEIEQLNSSNLTVSQIETHLMLTGLVEPSRFGVTFPIEQIQESIAELSFVEDCMLHHFSKAGSVFSRYFVLLVFVNPLNSKVEEEIWTEEIKNHLTSSLGSGYLPDKIEYFSLVPRKNILGVDRNWCAHQYNSGLLLEKKNLLQYKIMSALKKMIREFSMAYPEQNE